MKQKTANMSHAHKSTRLIDENTPFAITESFKHLRTNIIYTPNDREGCPIYAVTSAEVSVGKSTVTANLAISFAMLGKKVLLVDADLRRPTQHKIFNCSKKHSGLSELLAGINAEDSEVIQQLPQGISIITSGEIPPNPSELICSKKFEQLISKWRSEYDLVLIDMPPVGIVTDPIEIANSVNGYIMIAMANKSTAKQVNSAILQVRQTGAKIVGVVVNATNMRGEFKHRYSEHGYKRSYYSYSEYSKG